MKVDLNILTEDLKYANEEAVKAIESTNDGGSANLDSVFLKIPRIREEKVLAAIRNAGLYCSGKSSWRFMGNGYFINPTSGGMGNKRSKATQVMRTILQDRGWDVCVYYMMD